MLSRGGNTVPFYLSLVLLLAEIDPVAEEQSCKRYALRARGTGCVKIVLALPIEIVVLHVETLIIQLGVSGLENSILRGGVCLTMLLAFNKQF